MIRLLFSRCLALVVCGALLACGATSRLSPTLEQLVRQYNLNIDPDATTVSGLSAGAFFAVQFHLAYSSLVNGAAVFAGGPYLCAKGNLAIATTTCMSPLNAYQAPSPADSKQLAENAASNGLIDPLANVNGDPVYLYSGTLDSVVDLLVVQSAQQFYAYFTPVAKISSEYSIESEHTQPTTNYGNKCSRLASPYISKCSYDGAYEALSHMYGSLSTANGMVDKNLIKFDQTPYYSGTSTSINTQGYIYIPTSCQSGASCKLHVSFHGCEQDMQTIGDEYARNGGYNPWAEANNIVVLYPYVMPNAMLGNPNGCWDWWAYTGKDYAYKSGVQMEFVKSLIDAIMDGAF